MTDENGKKNGHANGAKKSSKKPTRPQRDVNGFADEIIKGKDATSAAMTIRPGVKRRNAQSQGARLLADPRVQERINNRLNDAASMTADEVIGILASQARTDASDFVEIFNLDLANEIRAKNIGHLIQEIEIREDKISYGEAARKRGDLAKQIEQAGATLTDEARSVLMAAAVPLSRTVRVRFHNSQQAAGTLSKLFNIQGEARDRNRDSRMRALVTAAVKQLAEQWNKSPEEVLAEYIRLVPEHAKYLN